MKIPYEFPCGECGVTCVYELRLDDDSPSFKCPNGHTNYGIFDLENTIGFRILTRSHFELFANEDFSMSIVLSAMAFDCELARLFRKWRDIDNYGAGLPALKDAEFEDEYRKLRMVKAKIESVAQLMDHHGIDAFLRGRPALCANSPAGIASGSFGAGIEREVFWPRNRILHQGDTHYRRADAQLVYETCVWGLRVLIAMDHERRKLVR